MRSSYGLKRVGYRNAIGCLTSTDGFLYPTGWWLAERRRATSHAHRRGLELSGLT